MPLPYYDITKTTLIEMGRQLWAADLTDTAYAKQDISQYLLVRIHNKHARPGAWRVIRGEDGATQTGRTAAGTHQTGRGDREIGVGRVISTYHQFRCEMCICTQVHSKFIIHMRINIRTTQSELIKQVGGGRGGGWCELRTE